MSIDFNVYPYFDDAVANAIPKNYMRILINPARAIQARELTQMQTIFHQQVLAFAKHIFKDGSSVYGGIVSVDNEYPYIVVNMDTQLVDPSTYEGRYIGYASAGTYAKIEKATLVTDLGSGTYRYQYRFHIRYVGGTFVVDPTPWVLKTYTLTAGSFVESAPLYSGELVDEGNAIRAEVNDGIIFLADHFIIVNAGSTFVDETLNDTGDYVVGFDVKESIVTSDDDSTLVDPAAGFYNENAPGADRYAITATLASYAAGSEPQNVTVGNVTTSFHKVIDISDGVVTNNQNYRPQYSDILDTLARRTYDESGDYTVRPFKVTLSEHDTTPSTKFTAKVSAGKAYVKGYEIEKIAPTSLDVDRALDTVRVYQESQSINYGWNIKIKYADMFGMFNIQQREVVFFRSQPVETLTITFNNTTHTLTTTETLSGVYPNLKKGNIIYLSGRTDGTAGANNNLGTGYRRNGGNGGFLITAVSGNVITIEATETLDDATESGATGYYVEVDQNVIGDSNGSARAMAYTQGTNGDYVLWLVENDNQFEDLTSKLSVTKHISVQQTGIVNGGAVVRHCNPYSFVESSQPVSRVPIIPLDRGPIKNLIDSPIDVSYNACYKIGYDSTTGINESGNAFVVTITDGEFADNNCVIALSNAETNKVYDPTDYTVVKDSATQCTVTAVNPSDLYTDTNAGVVKGHFILNIYQRLGYPRSKSSNSSTEDDVISDANGVATLSYEDVYELTGVYLQDDPQIDANNLLLSNPAIKIRPGKSAVYGNTEVEGLSASTTYDFTYKRYTHGTTGHYFAINSYPEADRPQIKSFHRNDGKRYYLDNAMDFRVMTSELVTTGVQNPLPGANILVDYNVYLPRKDKIIIDTKGNLSVIQGIPATDPEIPTEPPGTMSLVTMFIPGYTSNPKSVQIKETSVQRYRMVDIRNLEERIRKLEYYASLNALEKATLDMAIKDESGLEREKNGIFVDNMTTDTLCDLNDPEFRSMYYIFDRMVSCPRTPHKFDLSEVTGTYDVTKHNPYVTLDYTLTSFLSQPYASSQVSVNPYQVFLWEGTMSLSPRSANWISQTQAPDFIAGSEEFPTNNELMQAAEAGLGNSNRARRRDSIGSFFGRSTGLGNSRVGGRTQTSQDGEPTNFGLTVNNDGSVTATQNRTTRTTTSSSFTTTETRDDGGINTVSTTDRTTTTSLHEDMSTASIIETKSIDFGERVIDINFIGKIPATSIGITCSGLRPITTCKVWFDGVDVTSQCTGSVTTDAAGDLSVTLDITEGQFITGYNLPVVVNDGTSATDENIETIAKGFFFASGLDYTKQKVTYKEWDVEVNATSRVVSSNSNTVTSTRVQEGRIAGDPVGQSFIVEDETGIFVKEIDVYFKEKADTDPVSLWIVTNTNGIPSSNKVVFAEAILAPGSVNTSADASTATTFTFAHPVYLRGNGQEYTFIVHSNSPDYYLWASELGKYDVTSGDRIITQPVLGTMFQSQRQTTWTPIQEKDLKFTIRRCSFSSTGSWECEVPLSEFDSTGLNIAGYYFAIDDIVFNGTGIEYNYYYSDDTANRRFAPHTDYGLTQSKLLINDPVGTQRNLFVAYDLATNDERISPMINQERNSVLPYTYDLVDAGTYFDAGKFVTKTGKTVYASDEIRVFVDAMIPANCDMDVYYRTGKYQPMYVEAHTGTTFPEELANAQANVFWYNSSIGSNNLVFKTRCKITRIKDDSPNKAYISAIQDETAFKDSADFSVYDYNGSGDAIEYIVMTPEITTTTTNIAVYSGATAYNEGDLVFYNTAFWERIDLDGVTGIAPADDSTAWKKLNVALTATTVQLDTLTEWKPMKKDTAFGATYKTNEKENQFLEYAYVPEEYPDVEFDKFAVKFEFKASVGLKNNYSLVPAIRNIRTIVTI